MVRLALVSMREEGIAMCPRSYHELGENTGQEEIVQRPDHHPTTFQRQPSAEGETEYSTHKAHLSEVSPSA